MTTGNKSLSVLDRISDSSVRDAVLQYIDLHPDSDLIFYQLISHLLPDPSSLKPVTKKRKIDQVVTNLDPLLIAPALSFSTPQRKKLTLAIYPDRILLLPSPSALPDEAIHSVILPSGLPFFLHLQTPARATKQFNITLLPSSATPARPDAIIFTVPESRASFLGTFADQNQSLDSSTLFTTLFASLGISRVDDDATFAVPCHRGTKDGFLYFSAAGILFAFKKPVWYIPTQHIASISYSSITRMTFNLTIASIYADAPSSSSSSSPDEAVEFSMIGQEKFDEIDAYVKAYQLADTSMAEERKAKRGLKIQNDEQLENGSELIKAEQEWQQLKNDHEDSFGIESNQEQFKHGNHNQNNNNDNDNDNKNENDDDDEDDENFEVEEGWDDGGSPSSTGSDDDEQDL
ncbi:histone chaperone Rttp106-like-domain-containing protein [Lipomyces japonicus]|uniref:histone chaperone Rttp106-like-domain-containing protein n=1 Tax=Lipomyces japonicus TaxID=56871 RepID=UPI0034CF6F17